MPVSKFSLLPSLHSLGAEFMAAGTWKGCGNIVREALLEGFTEEWPVGGETLRVTLLNSKLGELVKWIGCQPGGHCF